MSTKRGLNLNKIVLDNKAFNEMPYANTAVSWTKTKGDIEGKLFELREKGVLRKHGWTTEGKPGEEVDTLYMVLELPISDTQVRTVNLKFQPTMIYRERWVGSKKKGNKRKELKLMKNTSWRLFWWHFKTKLEAALYGLVTLENEFMANIMHYLTDESGKPYEVTMGEALLMILQEDRIGSLLEHKKDDAKIIEAEIA